MQCAARASNGPNHLGLCGLQENRIRREMAPKQSTPGPGEVRAAPMAPGMGGGPPPGMPPPGMYGMPPPGMPPPGMGGMGGPPPGMPPPGMGPPPGMPP